MKHDYTGTEKQEYKGNKIPTIGTRMPDGYEGPYKDFQGNLVDVYGEPFEEKGEELPEGAEVYKGKMVKVKFIDDYEMVNENNEKTGEIIEAGDEIEIPEAAVKGLEEEGYIETVEEVL